MPITTDLTNRLGIRHPIIQAPMAGGGDTPRLVAAVSEAGGLGSIGAAYLTPEQIATRGAWPHSGDEVVLFFGQQMRTLRRQSRLCAPARVPGS